MAARSLTENDSRSRIAADSRGPWTRSSSPPSLAVVLRRRAGRRPRGPRARQHQAAGRPAARRSPAAGAGANIGISGVAALAASTVHVRAGRINWRLFAWMAPPSMAGAVVGGLPLRAAARRRAAGGHRRAAPLLRRRPPAPAGRASALARPSPSRPRHPRGGRDGAVIGVLGGFVGLILGALRMPALLRYVGETPARAVGTNLAVGVCVGLAGVIGHTPEGVDWDLLATGLGGLGARGADRRPPDRAAQRARAAAGDRRDADGRRRRHGRPGAHVSGPRAPWHDRSR